MLTINKIFLKRSWHKIILLVILVFAKKSKLDFIKTSSHEKQLHYYPVIGLMGNIESSRVRKIINGIVHYRYGNTSSLISRSLFLERESGLPLFQLKYKLLYKFFHHRKQKNMPELFPSGCSNTTKQ